MADLAERGSARVPRARAGARVLILDGMKKFAGETFKKLFHQVKRLRLCRGCELNAINIQKLVCEPAIFFFYYPTPISEIFEYVWWAPLWRNYLSSPSMSCHQLSIQLLFSSPSKQPTVLPPAVFSLLLYHYPIIIIYLHCCYCRRASARAFHSFISRRSCFISVA